jgi:hypothetical protein
MKPEWRLRDGTEGEIEMLIIKDVFGNIVCDVESIYFDKFNQVMVTHAWEDYTPESKCDQITEEFNAQYKARRVIDWIFEQMKSQRGAANIIIDMTECPVIQNEGAFADD